ncbi:hypothetical protein [Corynebacterium macginleyi]|uniref:hypothetical protein n=1 Tax=Corynebacterium macginleyi TaxID=38290 RepID=UPI00190D9243|nr:hypothetical protein [Corynebacterium macginleyi]MBK4163149.1 hypothetical protein [Corynebacterium macginleyi]
MTAPLFPGPTISKRYTTLLDATLPFCVGCGVEDFWGIVNLDSGNWQEVRLT